MWDIGNKIEFGPAGLAIRLASDGDTYRAPDAVNPAIGTMSFDTLIAAATSASGHQQRGGY
jgi:hypothetical protein